MKTEKLMDCIGQIDDDIIEEADTKTITRHTGKMRAGRLWIKWGSIAAAAAVCLFVVIPYMINNGQTGGPGGIGGSGSPGSFEGLPLLPVDTGFGGGFGFEAHLAYDVGELRNGNPWTEDNDLETMPVFTNPIEYDWAGAPQSGLSTEEMLARAVEVADAFGLEIVSSYTEPTLEEIEMILEKLEAVGASEEEIRQNTNVYRATAECEGAKIEVLKDGYILLSLERETAGLAKEIEKLSKYDHFCISFDFGYKIEGDTQMNAGLPLPNGYEFTWSTPHEQAMEITDYLISEYGAFTGITTPGYNLFAEYTYSGELSRMRSYVFENAGSLTERILNYHFNNLYFGPTDMGGLGSIGYFNYLKTDLSQKIGDYPIIAAEEARALLLQKHYITTVPEEMPGEKYIAGVELTYRRGALDTVFMPYYKFLVEMPEMQHENGLKTFGAFYVPAVKSEYLENMPVWDGSFN